MFRLSVLLAVVSGLVCVSNAQAASLQVSPVSLDLTAPARTSTITLRNKSNELTNIQVRAYKWKQVAGVDQLTPATEIIVSPPAAGLQPGGAYTIRVVHLVGNIQKTEESYRLLIDEIPQVNVHRKASNIGFSTRYSIPVFFSNTDAHMNLQWKVHRVGKNLSIEVINTGTRHAKLANLTVASSKGSVNFGEGLNGYVLPGSTMRWTTNAKSIAAGSHIKITAKGDDYAVDQAAVVSGG